MPSYAVTRKQNISMKDIVRLNGENRETIDSNLYERNIWAFPYFQNKLYIFGWLIAEKYDFGADFRNVLSASWKLWKKKNA